MIAEILLEQAITKGIEALGNRATTRLHRTDLQKAISASIQAAQTAEEQQEYGQRLFSKMDREKLARFAQGFFADMGVQDELLKPLQGEELPDLAFLTRAFEQVAQETCGVTLRTERIEPWLQAFLHTYLSQTRTLVRFQVAKQDYLAQVTARFDQVRFLGIAVESQREESRVLPDIFVMPDVQQEITFGIWNDDLQVGHWRSSLSSDYLPDEVNEFEEAGYRQYKVSPQSVLVQQQKRWAQRQQSDQQFVAQHLLSQQQKVVVLGAPGSGKTSLLNYFAVMLCRAGQENISDDDRSAILTNLGLDSQGDWLPILIPIRDWAQQPQMGLLEFLNHYAETRLSTKPLPSGFFQYWLEGGRALILLDGLDEVSNRSRRYEVVGQIEGFLEQYGQNRAIVSSRPAGYQRDFFRTSEFPHYQLLPFDPPKIDQFIERWYRSRTADAVEAQERQESLKRALDAQERLRSLAKNPLLLTIIALIHRYQARLPRERYRLYDKAVDTLLTAWDAGKFGDNDRISKTLKYLELDDLRLLLQGLAYWIHCYGSTGDQEGGTLIDREELLHQLSRMIRERHEFELYKAQAEAERIVVFIRERTGLLNEQGQDCYAFVHKTFQEYLTAEEIDYRRQSEDDFGILLEHIQQHLHDPHWQEVLLLLVAKQKGKQAARAIRTILNHGSAHEQWLHRDLFFAARCLAEDPKDIGRREQSLVNEVIDRLAKLEIYSLTYLSKKIREQVRTSLCGFSESSFENLVLARLTEDQNQINRWHFLEYQAALGAKDQAIKNLLGLIQDVAPTVRLKAINMLVQLNPPPDKVLVDTLLSLLQVSELQFPELSFYDEFIYDKAAYQLSILARKDILIEQKLLDSLSHPNPLMQYGALVALGYLGKSSDIIIQKILLLLEDADPKVCSEAIICLNCLGETSDVIIKRLLALLQESNFDYSKWEDSVIDIFSEFPIKRGQVKELLQLFEHPDELVRSQAVEIITGLAYGPSADGIREEILNLLNHSNLLVVASAIEVLGVLEPVSKPILDRLLTLFQNSSDIDLRCSVVWALGVLGQRCDKDIYQYICQGLFEALKAPELEVRFEALRALELLRPASKLVEQELFMLLQDQDLNVRLAAISALHISGRNSQPVIQQLLDLLQDPEPKIQRAVITALAGFGAISQPILTQLFKQLGDCELEVSLAILEVLEKSDGVSREIALKLINLLQGAEHPIQEKILSILSKRGKQEQDRDFITCKLIKWIEQHRGQTHMGLGIDTLWEIYN